MVRQNSWYYNQLFKHIGFVPYYLPSRPPIGPLACEACSRRDELRGPAPRHLFDLDGRQPFATYGLRRAQGRQTGDGGSAGSRRGSTAPQLATRELRLWAESAPMRVASGRTGDRAEAVIPSGRAIGFKAQTGDSRCSMSPSNAGGPGGPVLRTCELFGSDQGQRGSI
jgi:hypothetical protein